MKKTGIFQQDWFIALIIGLLFGFAILSRTAFLDRLEFIAYDLGVKMTNRAQDETDQIAIVAIDDPSIKQIGRWPWPRSVLADMLEKLTRFQARAVGLLVYFTEPQTDPGLEVIRDVRDRLGDIAVEKKSRPQLDELLQLLDDSEQELDTDRKLASAIPGTPRLHLPMIAHVGERLGRPDTPLPDYVTRNLLTKLATDPNIPDAAPQVTAIVPPLAAFGGNATGIGHLRFQIDRDNGIRSIYTVLEYDGAYFPSLPLLLAASHLNIKTKDIQYDVGDDLRIGKLVIDTDTAGRMYTGFYEPNGDAERAFPTYSFHDVQTDKVRPEAFKNKIVLIGPTADGVAAKFATPITVDELMSESELTANVIASILNQDFYTTPAWTGWAEIGIVVVLTLYLMFAMPAMSGSIAALSSLILLILLLGAEQYLMVGDKIWLRTVSPALLLVVGHLAVTSKRFFLTERLKLAAESDSAYSNRMLGLAFQAQGQLDMALDKFRKLPVDESVLELLYNLGLDFERKRQFHKAVTAYDYVIKHKPNFRDINDRKKRAQQVDQTIVLGARSAPGGTMILDGAEKPTLGRYAVERELGRGAMGTVYLGRDPKINRLVAIKTLALSAEFDTSELNDVRERFFREAETAGRLHHPNIVTIYDAGEEHDLAYIAMEYLEGKDLATSIGPDKKLPFDWILDVAVKISDALSFAHKNDVVHRDIKPANIVYKEADKSVKVTDFGIARITATSRTKTGVVLGTPSYMSPEQLAGKHVDGRSDQFSFGVMLYEMVTGHTPFTGDSLATLMYQIANAPTPDIRKARADTPTCLAKIIKALMQKDPEKRYANGDDLTRELEQCRNTLKTKA